MNAKQAKALKQAVGRLINAEVARSWMGSKDASEHADIIRHLREARAAYHKLLAKLTEGASNAASS